VQRHVEDALSKGATLLAGGRQRPDLGPFFYEPTVLTDVVEGMECFAEETFGPLVSVYRFGTDDEAVELANATRYGLNASVWSRSSRRGREVAARLRAGTVNVNEAYAAAWATPAWVAAMAPRASSSTPRPRPSPANGCSTWHRRWPSWVTTGSPRS
jgi:acyl-CoA reductase-like NAD-dependent aldehyde dehydrogenase